MANSDLRVDVPNSGEASPRRVMSPVQMLSQLVEKFSPTKVPFAFSFGMDRAMIQVLTGETYEEFEKEFNGVVNNLIKDDEDILPEFVMKDPEFVAIVKKLCPSLNKRRIIYGFPPLFKIVMAAKTLLEKHESTMQQHTTRSITKFSYEEIATYIYLVYTTIERQVEYLITNFQALLGQHPIMFKPPTVKSDFLILALCHNSMIWTDDALKDVKHKYKLELSSASEFPNFGIYLSNVPEILKPDYHTAGIVKKHIESIELRENDPTAYEIVDAMIKLLQPAKK